MNAKMELIIVQKMHCATIKNVGTLVSANLGIKWKMIIIPVLVSQ